MIFTRDASNGVTTDELDCYLSDGDMTDEEYY